MPDPFHWPLFEIAVKLLDPCVVAYLVVTLTLYHGLLQLKMKENDQILMHCHLIMSVIRAYSDFKAFFIYFDWRL